MPSKGDVFVQEFVLGFGFLGGLFAWVGTDPEEEVLRALLRVAFPNNDLVVSLVIIGIALATTVISILGTLAMGGKLGLLAVSLAWVAGFTMPMGGSLSILGTFLLIGAIILGPIACKH